jgi:putative FmdB family regulatory protein
MPTFEYKCDPCEAEFEELLTQTDEVKKYSQWHPCPTCGGRARRLAISITNFQFAGGVRGESGVHGNSGSHDLDYPTLDKAVGRSSEKKWERINAERVDREKTRRESGTNALSKVDGKVAPAKADILGLRGAAITKLDQVKKSS